MCSLLSTHDLLKVADLAYRDAVDDYRHKVLEREGDPPAESRNRTTIGIARHAAIAPDPYDLGDIDSGTVRDTYDDAHGAALDAFRWDPPVV